MADKLIELVSWAVLIAAVFALVRGGPLRPEGALSAPSQERKSALPELFTYIIGYGVALMLTVAAFAIVHWRWAPPSTALGIVFGLALLQIVVHFRCFLHVSLRGPAREDFELILFATLIVLLMVGGTLVVIFNLRLRM